jgi:hypothetical protein
MRRALATVAVVCGLGLLVVPFALSLFDRAPAGERVTNRFRQTMSVQGPSIKPGAVELVRRQVASVKDAAEMNGLDFTPLPWYIMGPGIALLLAGTTALAIGGRPEAAWNAVPGPRATGLRAS